MKEGIQGQKQKAFNTNKGRGGGEEQTKVQLNIKPEKLMADTYYKTGNRQALFLPRA